jgi:hypothetical protein
MARSNKSVKRVAVASLFTELPRRRVFSETGLPVYTVLGNSSAKRA